jgi:preprotein translocase subunit SecD
MTNVDDILRDADPLRHEPHPSDGDRERLRQTILAVGSRSQTSSVRPGNDRIVFLAIAGLIVAALIYGASHAWTPTGTVQAAAVRFEVKLAEDEAGPGLTEVRLAKSDRVIHLHPEAIVTNVDIDRSVLAEDGPSSYGVNVYFNAAGAKRMQDATQNHIGKPVAILIDGAVVMAPTLRSAISTVAALRGNFTKPEAQRIVDGIALR